MILGGRQRGTGAGTTRPVGGSSSSWDLTDQQGKVWELLDDRSLHGLALPVAVLVEGWVSG